MGDSTLPEDIEGLIRSQKLAVLATRGEEYPYGTLVGFAFSDDFGFLYFATSRDTRKFANIRRDPKVSLLIDSRSNSVDDFKDAGALTALGEAQEIRGKERELHAGRYLRRHPHLGDFIGDPNTALVRVTVSRYILVRRFQEVMELDLT